MSISLFLTKNAKHFLNFKTFFCCATCVVTVWWLTSLSAQSAEKGCSKKAMPVKRGKGNTRTYGIAYTEQSVCNVVCKQRWSQSPQLLQLDNMNSGTSHLLGSLPSEFLTVQWTPSNPSRRHSVVISVTLALIRINFSDVSCCIMTSARSSCIYSTFLEELEKTQMNPTRFS